MLRHRLMRCKFQFLQYSLLRQRVVDAYQRAPQSYAYAIDWNVTGRNAVRFVEIKDE